MIATHPFAYILPTNLYTTERIETIRNLSRGRNFRRKSLNIFGQWQRILRHHPPENVNALRIVVWKILLCMFVRSVSPFIGGYAISGMRRNDQSSDVNGILLTQPRTMTNSLELLINTCSVRWLCTSWHEFSSSQSLLRRQYWLTECQRDLA